MHKDSESYSVCVCVYFKHPKAAVWVIYSATSACLLGHDMCSSHMCSACI